MSENKLMSWKSNWLGCLFETIEVYLLKMNENNPMLWKSNCLGRLFFSMDVYKNTKIYMFG